MHLFTFFLLASEGATVEKINVEDHITRNGYALFSKSMKFTRQIVIAPKGYNTIQ